MRHFILAAILTLATTQSAFSQSTADTIAKPKSFSLNGQVFLRNEYVFSDDRYTLGASSSFVEKNGKVYVLTAKHLLGPDMGISPAVKPTEFNKSLEAWVVYHNNGDAALAEITSISHPNNDENEDIILLETNAKPKNVIGMTLEVTKTRPAKGEHVYFVGCPYSEGDNCKQNIYKAKVKLFENNLIGVVPDNPLKTLAGFSGAPILNARGEIIAVIYGGDVGLVVGTLLPDWIFE